MFWVPSSRALWRAGSGRAVSWTPWRLGAPHLTTSAGSVSDDGDATRRPIALAASRLRTHSAAQGTHFAECPVMCDPP
jgi:hypothetical protein